MTNFNKMNDSNMQELLTRFIHDIKSPLTVLNICNHYSEGLKIKERKEHILYSLQRIRNMVDSASSNLDNRNTKTNTIINIGQEIENIILEKKNEYLDHNIEFRYTIQENCKLIAILGSRDNFSRMLSNLINNAVDACSANSAGIIKIELNRIDNTLILYIEDNGQGMPAYILQKIRAGKSFSYGKDQGHGIGMQQVRDTLNQLRAKLDINSTPGSGSKFSMTFDLIM